MTAGDGLDDFENPEFNLDAYIASVVSTPDSGENGTQIFRRDDPTATPFADAAATRDAFATVRDALSSHAACASRHASELDVVAVGTHTAFLAQLTDVAFDTISLEATLDALDARVLSVASVARDAGDALRLAETRRAAADSAVTLARHLTSFDECAFERLPFSVDGLFFDEARTADAAALARRLLFLARETKDAVSCNRTAHDRTNADNIANGAVTISAFLSQATDNLERYCDGLENRLLCVFEFAESAGDDEEARSASAVLEKFQRGPQVARRFVATRPMFIDTSALAEIDALREQAPEYTHRGAQSCFSEKSALASAKRASVAVGAFFQNAGKDTVVELARARCVFPKAVVPFVSAALTQRVVERIGHAIDAALGGEPPEAPDVSFRRVRENSVRLKSNNGGPSSPTRHISGASTRKPPVLTTSKRTQSMGGDEQLGGINRGVVRSAPTTPAKNFASATRRAHRRAASVSVASRFGDITEALATVDLSQKSEKLQRSPSLPSNINGGISEDETNSVDADDDVDSDDESESECVVRNPERAFPLLAYLVVFAETNEHARRLAETLCDDTNGAVDIANAVDALFASRRARYDALEIVCLRGLCAAQSLLRPSIPEVSITGSSPPGSPNKNNKSGDVETDTIAMRNIARWYAAAARRVSCVFAPPAGGADRDAADDGFNETENQQPIDGNRNAGGALQTQPATTSRASSAIAIASANSLASAAAAENRVAEAIFLEMTRAASSATTRATGVCTNRANALPVATKDDPNGISVGAAIVVDACLGATLAAAKAVAVGAAAAKMVTKKRARAAETRATAASKSMQGGGDVAASASAAAHATADAACLSTSESLFKFEQKAGFFVARAIAKSLDLLFERLDTELKAKQTKKHFAFEWEDIADDCFPGQTPSSACVAALAILRSAIDVFCESAGNETYSHENVRAFAFDLITRFAVTVRKHFFELGRFSYSMCGALQLKRDLGEFESWARSVVKRFFVQKSGAPDDAVALKKSWRALLDTCDALLVPPGALDGLLKEAVASVSDLDQNQATSVFAKVVALRKDFNKEMLTADMTHASKSAHQRSGSSSFFGFRRDSPPPMR